MASEKQTEANRRNAKRSTGPKTPAGKRISRLNRLDHGLTSNCLLRDEDPEEFERLRESFAQQFLPLTGLKSELVWQLAHIALRQRRGQRFEAALVENLRARARQKAVSDAIYDRLHGSGGEEDHDDSGKKEIGLALTMDNRLLDGLAKLNRYQAAAMGAFLKTLRQLRELQKMDDTREGELIEATAMNDWSERASRIEDKSNEAGQAR
jgi:hypothetical protein